MDSRLPVVPDDGNLAWSDSHSIDSDDVQSAGPPSPWLGSLTSGSTSVSVSSSIADFARTGQLSPVSNGVNLPYGPARGPANSLVSPSQSPPVITGAHPAPPPVPVLAGSGNPGSVPRPAHCAVPERYGTHQDVAWEEEAEDGIFTVPKLEPLEDDDFCMDELQQAPSPPHPATLSSHLQAAPDQPKPKRPRGRPRKHPLIPIVATNKITKGRSKTGCLTCRKRKKKCDEAKPRCMNCEKNAVVCEGYPEKQIWKSGKERADEERHKTRSFASITMRPLFHCLEQVEDMVFWKHYNEHLSTVLTVEGEHKNAFKDMIVPIAVKHQGLMHSILSLASKHIDYETPYGVNILKSNPTTTLEALRRRAGYHHEQALLRFYRDVEFTVGRPSTDDKTLVDGRYGQMLCFLLEALVEGSTRGEHRPHLTAYYNLASGSLPEDSAFLAFIAEFFQYHLFADELINSAIHPKTSSDLSRLPPVPASYPPRLLGVTDGLLVYLSQITGIRNPIRQKMLAQTDPVVDYEDLYPASYLDPAIRGWVPHWPDGDSRDQVSLLYQEMMWIYLHRAIYPPSPSAPSSAASSAASLPATRASPLHGRPGSLAVKTPPLSASASSFPSPRLIGSGSALGSNPGNASRPSALPPGTHSGGKGDHTDAGKETSAPVAAGHRIDSPPPTRQPPNLESSLTAAVNESLDLLESFKPSDPCQTLLLLPCFLVGTACFTPGQQRRVRAAIRTVRGYTGLRNADRVVEVLEEIWRLMGVGDWVGAWDWPGVADRLGLDFVPA